MEVEETDEHVSNIPVVLEDVPCTVDTKAIEENGAVNSHLGFSSQLSSEQVSPLVRIVDSLKRKHDECDSSANKRVAKGDSYAENLVDLAPAAVSLAMASVGQESAPQTYPSTEDDAAHIVPCELQQEGTADELNLSATVVAIAAGGQMNQTPIIPAEGTVVPALEGDNDQVNQAWFTTKEDKDSLHGKGVKWRQGMWSKEENELLKSNILDYCKDNNIADPNVVIFEMSKDDRKYFYRTIAKGIRRPLFAIYRRVLRMYDRRNYVGKYSSDEVTQLRNLKEKHGNDWATIGANMGRSASSVKDRFRLLKENCQSGKWTPEEELRLSSAVHDLSSTKAGESVTKGISWAIVAERVGTRSEKQCRSKWLNYLNWKECGGLEWTKQDEVQLITRINEMDLGDENEINWQALCNNWHSVRSPQWLRSKWWALKKHVPNSITNFTDMVNFLHTTYTETLHAKIERQEARFKGSPVPRYSVVCSTRPVHLTSSSGIAHTITVSSDGTVTREDDNAARSQNRYEMIQVSSLPSHELYVSSASQPVQPSYIIQSVQPPTGQTYIIQQPTGHLVTHTHNGQLPTRPSALDTAVHDSQVPMSSRGVVMAAAVLQANHAVQTIPEVSPEFTQAIVQTDISGPITPSDLNTAALTQTEIPSSVTGEELQVTEENPEEDLSPEDALATVQTAEADLQADADISDSITPSELHVSQTEVSHEDISKAISESNSHSSHVTEQAVSHLGTKDITLVENRGEHVDVHYTQGGPAAIAQSLDGSQLPESIVMQHHDKDMIQTDLPHSPSPNQVSTAIHTVVTSLPSQHFSPVGCSTEMSHSTLDHSANVNVNDLSSREVIMPQAVLPDQILQPHIDDTPPELSPTPSSTELVVSESSTVVTVAMSAVSGGMHHSLVHGPLNCVVESTGTILHLSDDIVATTATTVSNS